jgi:thiol-disulfide isomerase/thioredoxin
MLKRQILSVLFLSFLFACEKGPSYEIHGSIENYDGYVFLRHGNFVDSAKVEDGSFYFEGATNRVVQATITNAVDGPYTAPFFLDNDSVNIQTSYQEPFITLIDVYSPANALPEQILTDLGAIMEDEEKLRSNAMFLYMDSITLQHSNNDFVLELISEVITSDFITIQQAETLLGQIDTTLMHPSDFKSLKLALDRQERLNPGDQFPVFTFNGLNGEVYTKESFPDQYVLIDVWATWCGPCLDAFEELKPLYEELDGQLEIIGLSIDKTQDRPINFLKQNELPWKQAWTEDEWNNTFLQQLGVVFVPFYYLISPEGEILAINPNVADIPDLIKRKGNLKEVLK